MNLVQPIRSVKKLEKLKRVLAAQSERDLMLFLTGANTGLRISDLLTLRVRDVKGTHITLREKKTHKRKRAKINKALRQPMDAFIDGLDDRVFLFRSRIGVNKPLTTSGAYRTLKKASITAGIPDLGTHTMRKTFGYFHYKKKKDVVELMQLFNHSKPEITLSYIGKTADDLDNSTEAVGI